MSWHLFSFPRACQVVRIDTGRSIRPFCSHQISIDRHSWGEALEVFPKEIRVSSMSLIQFYAGAASSFNKCIQNLTAPLQFDAHVSQQEEHCKERDRQEQDNVLAQLLADLNASSGVPSCYMIDHPRSPNLISSITGSFSVESWLLLSQGH